MHANVITLIAICSIVRGFHLRMPGSNSVIHADVEVGSDTYFTLPLIRHKLVQQVQSANDELQRNLNHLSKNEVNVTRGILVYIPIRDEKFLDELKWLYLSIGVMRISQPLNVKTDLLIFTPPANVEKMSKDLGCRPSVREGFACPEGCIVLPHVPLTERSISLESDLQYVLKNYSGVIDSVLILSEFMYADNYTYLMRTDLDTFFTPGFGAFHLPPSAGIAVGTGGYWSHNAALRLQWIAEKKLGLKYNRYENVGSTWYGRSKALVSLGKLSISIMEWLTSQEFSEFESLQISGTDGWPHWYKPVLSMYAGDIAINQVPHESLRRSSVVGGTVNFDFSACDSHRILDSTVQHLHVFQYQDNFSKLKFHAGFYHELNLTPFLAMKTPPEYATVIAISSSRMNLTELASVISSPIGLKDKNWIKVCPRNKADC